MIPYKKGAGPFPPEIYHLPFPSPSTGTSLDDVRKALSQLFSADIEPDRVAAFIFEPVQGEGGFNIVSPELLHLLDELRDRHGILIIADEVQTGFARTGRLFAMEHFDVAPDLIAVAKSLAGGFPLAGVIGRAEIMDVIEPGGLGGTFGGSPIAIAAAHAVLDLIDEAGLNARAEQIGQKIEAYLRTIIAARHPLHISGLRRLGAMIAFDMLDEHGCPDGDKAKRVCACALEEGLILLNCGGQGQAIRILVPLTASDAVIEEGLEALGRALDRHHDEPIGRPKEFVVEA